MDNDDHQIGRILSRREMLALLGAAGAAVLAGCVPGQSGTAQPSSVPSFAPALSPTNIPTRVPSAAATGVPTSASTLAAAGGATQVPATANVAVLPACIVRPAMTEGPYFVDEKLNRSDIRSDPSDGSVRPGAPLTLTFRVSQINSRGCVPLAGAIVDVWHCDALGVYSDASDPSFSTRGKKFLRGYQVSNTNGAAQFTTIYPGWYQGRAVHIHFKIRTGAGSGAAHDFTSQLFFDEAFTDQVYTQAPYAARGRRTVRNEQDGIFQNGGKQLLLNVTPQGQGYAATFDIGLQIG